MYYLIDLTHQIETPFATRLNLLAHWRFRLHRDRYFMDTPPLNFQELNITGNDMFATEFAGPWLRQFQVVDEFGRSQDIRTWTKEIEAVNAMTHFPRRASRSTQTRFRMEPAGIGSKLPLRKIRHSAFTKQRLIEACGAPKLDLEDDLLGFTPLRDNSAPKKPKNHLWKSDFSGSSRSWKDSTKNAAQWGRHIERVKEMPTRKNDADELDVEGLIQDLMSSNDKEVPAPTAGEMAVMLIPAAASCEA